MSTTNHTKRHEKGKKTVVSGLMRYNRIYPLTCISSCPSLLKYSAALSLPW